MANEMTGSNTNHKIFGKGKGFPRLYEGKPCFLDALRILLAGGTRRVADIVSDLNRLGWMPEGLSDPTHYTCNILSTCKKKGLVRRERVGHYRLPVGDVKPVQWVSKHKPELLSSNEEGLVVATPVAVKRRRSAPIHRAPITIEGTNGQSQSARRLRGKLDFCWPGTERALFTVKFEIYPSNQSL